MRPTLAAPFGCLFPAGLVCCRPVFAGITGGRRQAYSLDWQHRGRRIWRIGHCFLHPLRKENRYIPVSFHSHRLHHGSRHVDSCLRCISCAHQIGLGAGVQPEGSGNPGNLSCRQHQSKPQQGMILDHHESRNEDGGLQKCGQTQSDNLLAPADKAVKIAAGNRKYIK